MKRILSVTVICVLLLTCCFSISSCNIRVTSDVSHKSEEKTSEKTSENTTGDNFADEKRYENSGFQTGSGTQNDPFIIRTVEDLENLRGLINGDRHNIFCTASFALGDDIDLENREWTPIGVFTDRDFQGRFDGAGYSILNFKITTTQSNADAVGLFGNSSGVITDLSISGFNIDLSPNNYVKIGGIVGNAYGSNSAISNCQATDGKVRVISQYPADVGGICGAAHETDITQCNSSSTVHGEFTIYRGENAKARGGSIGGICGKLNDGTISQSFDSGKISVEGICDYYVGGLVGFLDGDIVNSYAISNISLNASGLDDNYVVTGAFIGGLAGFAESGRISACYSSGSIDAMFKYAPLFAGGLIGVGYSKVVLSDCLSATNIAAVITAYEASPSVPITLLVGYFSGEYCYDITLDNCYRSTSASLEGRFASFVLPANECYIEPYASSGLSSCETGLWNSVNFYKSTLGWNTGVWNIRNNSLPTLY